MVDGGHLAGEVFLNLHARAGEAEAVRLRRDLEAASVPLHDVVVADDAFVEEAADPIQVLRRGPPGLFELARGVSEAGVVVS